MRRIGPRTLPLILFGALLLLSFLGVVAGVASFLLLRAGYGPLVWGLAPPLALLLAVLVVGVVAWLVVGRPAPGAGRRSGSEEEPDGGSSRGDR